MQLFQIYGTMSPEQKIDSIRKAVRPLSRQDCGNLSELIDMINQAGLQREVFSDLRSFPQQNNNNYHQGMGDFNSSFIL